MGWLDFIKPIDKAVGIVSEYVEDKDATNKIIFELENLKQQVYITELNAKTVPWVDALHKMGRQILSLLSLIIPGALIYYKPDVDPAAIMAMVAPGGVYNYIKGK